MKYSHAQGSGRRWGLPDASARPVPARARPLFAAGVWATSRAERLARRPPLLLEIGPIPEGSGIWHLIQTGWLSPASILERAVGGVMECSFTFRHEEEATVMTQQLVLRQDATIADLRALLQSRSGDCLLGFLADTKISDLGWLEGANVQLLLKVLAWGKQENQERFSRVFRAESLRFYLRSGAGLTYEDGQQSGLTNHQVYSAVALLVWRPTAVRADPSQSWKGSSVPRLYE